MSAVKSSRPGCIIGPTCRAWLDFDSSIVPRAGLTIPEVKRFYLHQANKRVLEAFIRQYDIPAERVPMHMERYGNMVTAGTLVLLAEDLRAGVVKLGSGEPVVMAALGAGAQSAAHVIRL